ncbi:MAG: hypothetical protein A3I89_00415 [Candidatus Harrisonbacteria bacterium RIFCSPLOWO2_02_FULL_41_11]|uniref:Cell division protein FtsL n=1 Tax=Candidatus Harrisonbacteria bacterium RIFCSPHIGHO2_02_FULL_42_16 TaxID=1798404 RepID=A0A1G1ZIM3_9BACT|nr:MAG: hypothetical protein A3B92_02565 [Candidatus Harrisonbacteria bacterium RIFCSPHIGHO2_02_FULL_42_16]OGY67409.1 MAG: hypothetical protein A3I89_00415 [Candidatus Harrisonbacteria bacterium RIFCSPLOWO2_02_FULL_41_11]
MKRVLTIILFLILATLSAQFYKLYIINRKLSGELFSAKEKVSGFLEENKKLQADLEYFAVPENLEKELRGQFNYKKPGEKLIIAVPPKSTTTVTTEL